MRLVERDSPDTTLVVHRNGTWKRTRGGQVIEDGTLCVDTGSKQASLYYTSGPNKGKRRHAVYDKKGGEFHLGLGKVGGARPSDLSSADSTMVYKLEDKPMATYTSESDKSQLVINSDGSWRRTRDSKELDSGRVDFDSAHGTFEIHYSSGGKSRSGTYEVVDGNAHLSFSDKPDKAVYKIQ